ncbi:MAG: hypothetical protein ACRETD_10855, partial [Steroidobacteraceae bacterium]
MRTALLSLVALVGGCHWALNDPGTDPKAAQLYFPAGIAMDPGGRFAYVSNGNADLRFGGGTVMIVDMLSFECTVARWREVHPGTNEAPQAPPTACRESAESYDLRAQAARCQRDPDDSSSVDCDETQFILQNSTVRIGNFAGTIRVQT